MPHTTFNSIELSDYQKGFLYNDKRFTVVEASTKAGKTQPCILWLLQTALNANPVLNYDDVDGKNFWWVAPVYSQARIAFRRMKKIVKKIKGFSFRKMEIETPLGSIITFKSAEKPDNLFGEDVYACVFDEYSRARKEAWNAIYSTLTATKGVIKAIGNYKGLNNWGHKLMLKAQKDDRYYHAIITAWDAVEAGILERQIIEDAQSDLHPDEFNALYLCKGSIDDLRLFMMKWINKVFGKKKSNRTGEYFITADLAFDGSDLLVIGIWDGLNCFEINTFKKSSGRKIKKLINKYANKYNVSEGNIVYDADGGGMGLSGILKGKKFKNGKKAVNNEDFVNLKAECIYKLAELMKKGKITVCKKYRDQISEEMEYIRKVYDRKDRLGVNKKSELRKIIGRSTDFLDMLYMRMIFLLEPEIDVSFEKISTGIFKR